MKVLWESDPIALGGNKSRRYGHSGKYSVPVVISPVIVSGPGKKARLNLKVTKQGQTKKPNGIFYWADIENTTDNDTVFKVRARTPLTGRGKPKPIRSKPKPIRSKPKPIRSKPKPIRSKPKPIRSKPKSLRDHPNYNPKWEWDE
jgi:hypothetical protein